MKNKEDNRLTTEQKLQKKAVIKFSIFTLIVLSIIGLSRFSLNIVPTSSMDPTISTGSVTVGKIYKKGSVQRFDVVNIKMNASQAVQSNVKPHMSLCKRVIGLGGEKVEIIDGKLYINDEYIEENFLSDACKVGIFGPYYVPDGYVFIMGDNRNNSLDSRYLDDPYFSDDNIVSIVSYCFNSSGTTKM